MLFVLTTTKKIVNPGKIRLSSNSFCKKDCSEIDIKKTLMLKITALGEII